jgi:hypothetical protein
VPWSRKGTAIPLLPLWTVRPVQSLSACTRVHFKLLYALDKKVPMTTARLCLRLRMEERPPGRKGSYGYVYIE